jgi:two-component system chemotaxis response regulator CheY
MPAAPAWRAIDRTPHEPRDRFGGSSMTTARPGTFLLVDDSPLTHQMYRLVFSRGALAGSTLLHAMNGREGYGLLAAHPEISLVLLDLNMPEMNGLEFLERRRAEGLHPEIPVVLVTTESTADDEARGRDAGAAEYLRKPFVPADLERLVARIQRERPAA